MSEHRTQEETAQIMTERGYPMSRARVQQIETEALKKMQRHPLMKELAEQLRMIKEDR
jgi:DNA-directed RNA polymerase sigma subunit (sigma70/sigma32)